MDLSWILLWTVAVSAVGTIAGARRARMPGWIVVGGLLLGCSAAAWALAPANAGYIAGAVWGVFVMLPGLAARWLLRLLQEERFAAAARLASVIRILHPADGWPEQPRWFGALEAARAGRKDEAIAILSSMRGPVARQAAVYLLRIEHDWDRIAALSDDEIRAQPGLTQLRLRAIGETRGPEALAEEYARLEPRLGSRALALVSDYCRLFLFCFSGHREGAAQLLAGTMRRMAEPTRRFWLATADLAAGRRDQGRAEMERLRHAPSAIVREDAARRLERPLAEPGVVAVAVADKVAQSLALEERHGLRAAGGRRSAPVTIALIAVLAVVFLIQELSGGSSHPPTLYRLGAFWPPAIADGEWWRIATFTVLHFGLLHVALNTLGLAIVGPPVERLLGGWRLLVLYLLSTVGGGTILYALTRLGAIEPALTIGASGGVMGLIGATAATLARGWLASRNPALRRRLAGVVAIVALQTAFDLLTPGVSAAGHAVGFTVGLVAALALRPAARRA